MFCPLRFQPQDKTASPNENAERQQCLGNQCAWWNILQESCAALVISQRCVLDLLKHDG